MAASLEGYVNRILYLFNILVNRSKTIGVVRMCL